MLKQCCQFNEQKLDPWFCENFKSRLVLREFQIKTGFCGNCSKSRLLLTSLVCRQKELESRRELRHKKRQIIWCNGSRYTPKNSMIAFVSFGTVTHVADQVDFVHNSRVSVLVQIFRKTRDLVFP